MKVFDALNSKNVDELAKWFNDNFNLDYAPWVNWWDKNHCDKCESIFKDYMEWAWCEINGKCKFYKELDSIPNNEQMIKLWLESEI